MAQSSKKTSQVARSAAERLIEKGIQKGEEDTTLRLIRNRLLTFEQIASLAGVEVSYVEKIAIQMDKQVSEKAGQVARSAAERLIEKGVQKGREEGKEDTTHQLIENMIRSQLLTFQQIAAIARVEIAQVENIAYQMTNNHYRNNP